MLSNMNTPAFTQSNTTLSHSLEAQIGNTPLIQLAKTAVSYQLPPTVSLYAKAEWFNPGGSVKDRAALNIIRTAEAAGQLQPGMTIMDATSGNTGIAYAMLGAARGYKVRLALPGNVSPERVAILRAYGAELILTDPLEGSDGAIQEARRLAVEDPTLFYADQYNNDANWQAHYWTTANEIWQQTGGEITRFVAGLGIAGFTIGFALKDVAENFVAGILLLIQQPFDIGDAVEAGGYSGTVTNIEIRTTTIRTWDGKTHIEPFKVLKAFHKPKGKPENLVVKRSKKSPGLVIFIAQDGLKNGEIRRYFLPD